jgi:hypothetical protein
MTRLPSGGSAAVSTSKPGAVAGFAAFAAGAAGPDVDSAVQSVGGAASAVADQCLSVAVPVEYGAGACVLSGIPGEGEPA